MKTIKRSLLALCVIVIGACSSTKKSSKPNVASGPVPATTNTSSSAGLVLVAKSPNGVYEPGNEELIAVRAEYKDVTLEKLKEGHALYVTGACVKCHSAKSIYNRDTAKWKDIIDNMAQRANLSNEEKDAVTKYVLSIKATQPK